MSINTTLKIQDPLGAYTEIFINDDKILEIAKRLQAADQLAIHRMEKYPVVVGWDDIKEEEKDFWKETAEESYYAIVDLLATNKVVDLQEVIKFHKDLHEVINEAGYGQVTPTV